MNYIQFTPYLGCGNSELPFEIAESGYKKVANVDFAENVIEHMRKVTQDKNNENYAEITWHVGDCLNNLASYLPSGQKYAVLIDKSTIDCIACGDDDQQSIVKTAAREFLSVAKPNAFWFSISFSGEREFYCNNSEDSYWHTIEKIPVQIHQKNDRPGAPPIFYYIYVNRKVTTATSQ